MRKHVICLAAFLLAGLLLAGCSKKEEQVVAKVGNRSITISDLNARVQGVPYTSWDDELKKRKDILDGMINDELMIMAAQEQNYDKDPDFAEKLSSAERNALLELLYKKEILEKSTPSEKEIKSVYDMMGWELRARHILVATEEEAETIYQQAMGGADFAALAEEKTMDPASKSKGGDLGYFGWGKMVEPFQDSVFAMEIGDISKPFQSRFGWHVVKLEDRRTIDRRPYEEEKERIERKLTSDRSKQLSEEYVTKVKEDANIELNADASQILLNNFMAKKTTPEDFTPEEMKMTLVTFKGGSWDMSHFVMEFKNIPPMYQPRVQSLDDLDALIKNLLTGQLLEEKARKMGLQNDKELTQKLRTETDKLLLRTFQEKGVPADTLVSEEEITAYYTGNADKFSTLDQAHVLEIQVDTEEEALAVLKQLRAGAKFSKLAEEKSTRQWAAKKGGDLGWLDKRRYPQISGAALQMKVGELGGPIQDGPKYSVIRVLEKKPGELQPLQDVRDSIERTLLRDKQVDATKKWLAEQREKVGVEIYENVLLSSMTTPKETPAS